MSTLNKTELVKVLRKNRYKDLTPNDLADVIIEAVANALSSGKGISFRNVITLRKTPRKARYVPKPNTDERVYVPAGYGYRLILSKTVKRKLNQGK